MKSLLRLPVVVFRTGAVLAAMLAVLFSASDGRAQTAGVAAGVKVTQTPETFTLDNGVIVAVVSRRSGDLISMTYKGTETLTADAGGHSAVYWSHDVTGGVDVQSRISIDPARNGGERAEVSVKGISGGNKMGHGPGTPTDGNIPVDIDIRYALERGAKGVYTYVAFDHRPEYPTATMGEARIAVELARWFEELYVDEARSGRYPLMQNADKYVYVTRQADERTSGWTSTAKKIGWFQLNPSAEYLSGGPNKAEFTAHGDSAVLNYWKSSHYGGSNVTVVKGERWTRVVGPFMFYVNEGTSHAAMVADAKAQLKREEAKWPYAWVDVEGFAKPATRSEVVGQIALNEPLSPTGSRYTGRLTVGLAPPTYTVPTETGGQTTVEWQADGKYLQFWSRNVDPSGRFSVPNVAPGKYTLYAFADGVMGEFSKADIVVGDKGGKLDLGRIEWTPDRKGRQLWEIGVSDRDAREFNGVETYFQPDAVLRYSTAFPNGVTFRVGQSDTRKDWYFAHVPTVIPGSTPVITPFSGINGSGAATAHKILFTLPQDAKGAANLRIAFTHNSAPGIEIAVNGTPVGVLRSRLSDNAITRHQIYGRFSEGSLAFDASLMKAGENTLTMTVPAGSFNTGAIYDVIRLELDEAAATPVRPAVLTLARPTPPAAPAGAGGPPRPAGAGPAAGPAAGPPAAPPQAVFTYHDDARFGLPAVTVGARRFVARPDAAGRNALYVEGQGAPRLLVNPETLGTATLDQWRVSPDGKLVAYAIVETPGSTQRTIRVVNADTGATLPDDLRWAQHTAIAWAKDSKGFFYSRVPAPPPGSTRAGGAQEVYFHTLGQQRADDRRMVASDRGGMIHYAEITDDGRWLVVNGSVGANGRSEINLVNLNEAKQGPFKAMRMLKDNWQFAGSKGDMLYFVTTYDAPQGRLVSMDVSKSSLPIAEVVPQTAQKLQAARFAGGKLHLSYAANGANSVKVTDLP